MAVCTQVATVMINYMVWDKHANSQGMLFLLVWYVCWRLPSSPPPQLLSITLSMKATV